MDIECLYTLTATKVEPWICGLHQTMTCPSLTITLRPSPTIPPLTQPLNPHDIRASPLASHTSKGSVIDKSIPAARNLGVPLAWNFSEFHLKLRTRFAIQSRTVRHNSSQWRTKQTALIGKRRRRNRTPAARTQKPLHTPRLDGCSDKQRVLTISKRNDSMFRSWTVFLRKRPQS